MLAEITETDDTIKNEFTSYEEIETAVRNGEKVCWANGAYDVVLWELQDDIMVVCNINQSAIGLGDTDYDISRCFRVHNIEANYNESLVGEDTSRNFGVEIGQGGKDFEAQDNLTDYEFFATENEAIERATEINEMKTSDWSRL